VFHVEHFLIVINNETQTTKPRKVRVSSFHKSVKSKIDEAIYRGLNVRLIFQPKEKFSLSRVSLSGVLYYLAFDSTNVYQMGDDNFSAIIELRDVTSLFTDANHSLVLTLRN
jgi:hypothetical protein